MVANAEVYDAPSGLKGRLVAAGGVAGLVVCAMGALGLATSSSDAMIQDGFGREFARLSAPAEMRGRVPGIPGRTEDEWLRVSSANPDLIKTAAVGQEIRVTGIGSDHTLKIVGVSDLGEASTHIDTSAKPARVLLITCRDGDEATGTEYRIRFEGGFVQGVSVAERARAL